MKLTSIAGFVCALVAVSVIAALKLSGVLDALEEMRGAPRRDR